MPGYSLEHPPNYINPETRVATVLGSNISLSILALIFVSIRIFIRAKVTKIWADDILILIAWVLTLANTICVCLACRYGHAHHNWDIRQEWRLTYGKLGFTFVALYNPTLIFTKSSILMFYMRLAPHPRFRKVCVMFIVYVVCSSTAIFLVNIFGCKPIEGGWNHLPTFHSKCVNKTILYYVSGINNLVTDICLMVMPIPILMRLKMPMRVKLGLCLVFSMGFLVTAVSCIRIYMVKVAMNSNDYPWDGAYSSMWSAIELNVAIVCACMPAFKTFLSWASPGIMGSEAQSTQYIKQGAGYDHKTDDSGNKKRRPYGHNVESAIIDTHISHTNGSEEYIMNELEPEAGITKSTEVRVETNAFQESKAGQGQEKW